MISDALKRELYFNKNDEEVPEELPEGIQIVNEADLETRDIFLYSPVTDESAQKINERLVQLSLINQYEPITLYINSPGGSVIAGLSIIDTMKAISAPVVTIVTGYAASMGAVISICGDYRMATKHSFWMTHPMTTGARGDLQTCNDSLKFSKELDKVCNKILMKQTNIPEELLIEKGKLGELWLNSSKQKKYRTVDYIIPCKFQGVVDLSKAGK